MPGDPQECRLQAEHCLRLAEEAADPASRSMLSTLAGQWMRLAKDFENANAFLAAMEDMALTTDNEHHHNKKGDGFGLGGGLK